MPSFCIAKADTIYSFFWNCVFFFIVQLKWKVTNFHRASAWMWLHENLTHWARCWANCRFLSLPFQGHDLSMILQKLDNIAELMVLWLEPSSFLRQGLLTWPHTHYLPKKVLEPGPLLPHLFRGGARGVHHHVVQLPFILRRCSQLCWLFIFFLLWPEFSFMDFR